MMRRLLYDFERYLLTEKLVAANTVAAYTSDLKQFLDFIQLQGVTDIESVTKHHVRDFAAFLQDNNIGATSMSRKLSSLKAWCNWMHLRKNTHNFMDGVIFPKLPQKLPRYITQDDMEKILKTAAQDTTIPGKRNAVMIYIMYVCGIRVSELVSITLPHIQYDSGLLKIVGKGSKERLVPLPLDGIKVLQTYIREVHPQLHVGHKVSKYLFPVIHGKRVRPMSRQSFWMILRKIVIQAGLQPELVSPHVLRHSLATHLLTQGANLRLLQTILGHQQLETVQIYTHVDVTHIRKLYDKYHIRA